MNTQLADDAQMLVEMGCRQELHRGMSGFSTFAVSFPIISIRAGCISPDKIASLTGSSR